MTSKMARSKGDEKIVKEIKDDNPVKDDPGIPIMGSVREKMPDIIDRHWQEISLEDRGMMFGSGELVSDDLIANNVRRRVAQRLRKMYPDEDP